MKTILILSLIAVFAYAAVKEDLMTEDLPGCGHFDFNSYSGYIPVDDSNKFHYVFLESQNKPETDPLLIWFTGGPGCSSMLAYFMENGPCVWDGLDDSAEPHFNEYSWNAKANVLYVENPAGVGFNLGYKGEYIDDEIAGKQELNFTLKFFELYPEYLKNELYVTGESYGGIYVPYLAYYLHAEGHTTKSGGNINLQGIAVGNGVTDWTYDTTPAYIAMSYAHGLIPFDLHSRLAQAQCDFSDFSPTPLSKECEKLANEWYGYVQDINVYDIYREPRDGGLMVEKKVEDHLKGKKQTGYTSFSKFHKNVTPVGLQVPQYLNRKDVREIFHITEKKGDFQPCVNFNYHQLSKATLWIYPILKEGGYRILKYSGDTDGAVPTLGTEAWIEKLGWDIKINHRPFEMNDKVAGYYTERDGLDFVIFHGVGHLVPMWMREESQSVLYLWLEGKKPKLS